mmetsp:Transcript_123399/g.394168  ORF Transcript_123399/g.394168 Transcript_123399/m.394168 type:complete len:110 (-) Transcript_123399:117-446(-)
MTAASGRQHRWRSCEVTSRLRRSQASSRRQTGGQLDGRLVGLWCCNVVIRAAPDLKEAGVLLNGGAQLSEGSGSATKGDVGGVAHEDTGAQVARSAACLRFASWQRQKS